MLTDPGIPTPMLISLMDRYGLKSCEVRKRWREAYGYWLTNEMRVFHNRHLQSVQEAVYLRVIFVCEPDGPRKEALRYAAAELALLYRHAP